MSIPAIVAAFNVRLASSASSARALGIDYRRGNGMPDDGRYGGGVGGNPSSALRVVYQVV